jgi:LEA14-like dessication related protein
MNQNDKNTTLVKVVGLSALFSGIYSYLAWNLELLENFDYTLARVKILNSSITDISVEVDINVINQSHIAVTITNYDFDVYLNGTKVGNISNASTNQVLKGAGRVSRFSMRGDINTLSLVGSGLASIFNWKNSILRLDGYYGVQKGFVKLKNIYMNESFKVGEEENG